LSDCLTRELSILGTS